MRGERALQYAHDVFDDDLPRLGAIAADVKQFGPFLWDPHLTGGNALLAQWALPPVGVDVALSFLVSPFVAYMLTYALLIFLAGLSIHLFLRDSLRLPPVACFVGGVIALFAFWHYIYGFAAPLLPLALWLTDRAALRRPGRWRAVIGLVGLAAFMLATSQIQIVLLVAAVQLAYLLVVPRPEVHRVQRLLEWFFAWAVAVLLLAPVLLAQLVAIPDSQRQIWDLGGPGIVNSVIQTAQRYLKVIFGIPVAPNLGGTADFYGSYFVGAAALPFLALSLAAWRDDPRRRFVFVLLCLLPLLDLAATLVMRYQGSVPLLASFQFVRVRHLVPPVLAILAAVGVAEALRSGWRTAFGTRLRVGLLLGAALAIAVQVAIAGQHVLSIVARRRLSGLFASTTNSGWLLALAGLLLGLAVVAALIVVRFDLASRVRLRAPARVRALSPAVAATVVAVLLLGATGVERAAWARSERYLKSNVLGTWADEVSPTPAMQALADMANPNRQRVLVLGEAPNRLLGSGLFTTDGYEVIYPLRYHQLYGALTAPYLDANPNWYKYFHSWGNRAYAFGPEYDPELADLLGVRWIYARGNEVPGEAGLKEVFRDASVTVYERPTVFPRTFVAHTVTRLPDRPAVIAAMKVASRTELQNTAYVAEADAHGVQNGQGTASAADAARIESYTPDRVTIRAHVASPGVLVLTDTIAPGWTAQVDGQSAPVIPVDDALRGVQISAGDHQVVLAYRPVAQYIGLVLSLLGLITTLGWAVAVRDRPGVRRPTFRRRHPPRAGDDIG